MGKLSTHILDTANGIPAQGIKLDFYRIQNNENRLIKSLITNSDGRTDELLLDETTIEVGEYSIVFHVADYFRPKAEQNSQPAFLDKVPINFGISDANANYHVPLLVSPWSYSTYRGS